MSLSPLPGSPCPPGGSSLSPTRGLLLPCLPGSNPISPPGGHPPPPRGPAPTCLPGRYRPTSCLPGDSPRAHPWRMARQASNPFTSPIVPTRRSSPLGTCSLPWMFSQSFAPPAHPPAYPALPTPLFPTRLSGRPPALASTRRGRQRAPSACQARSEPGRAPSADGAPHAPRSWAPPRPAGGGWHRTPPTPRPHRIPQPAIPPEGGAGAHCWHISIAVPPPCPPRTPRLYPPRLMPHDPLRPAMSGSHACPHSPGGPPTVPSNPPRISPTLLIYPPDPVWTKGCTMHLRREMCFPAKRFWGGMRKKGSLQGQHLSRPAGHPEGLDGHATAFYDPRGCPGGITKLRGGPTAPGALALHSSRTG